MKTQAKVKRPAFLESLPAAPAPAVVKTDVDRKLEGFRERIIDLEVRSNKQGNLIAGIASGMILIYLAIIVSVIILH